MLRKLRMSKIEAVNRSGERTNLPESQGRGLHRIPTQSLDRRTTSELFQLITRI
jgi:hypothetical protein